MVGARYGVHVYQKTLTGSEASSHGGTFSDFHNSNTYKTGHNKGQIGFTTQHHRTIDNVNRKRTVQKGWINGIHICVDIVVYKSDSYESEDNDRYTWQFKT